MRKMLRWLLVCLMLPAAVVSAQAPAVLPALPVLDVTPCGTCSMRRGVVAAIKRAYAEAAEYEGYTLDSSRQAVLIVTDYVERNPRTASVLGPLAGRDYLRGALEWEGEQVFIEDGASSTFADMMVVAENIGIAAQKHVMRMIQEAGAK